MLIYVDQFYRLLLQPILCNPMQLTECTTRLKQRCPDALRPSVKNVIARFDQCASWETSMA